MSRIVKDASKYFFISLLLFFLFFGFFMHINQVGLNRSGTNASGLFPAPQMVDMVHERLAEYPLDVLRAAGHQLDDLILSCIYNTDECL